MPGSTRRRLNNAKQNKGWIPPSFAPQIKGARHSKKQNHRKMISAANAAFISLF